MKKILTALTALLVSASASALTVACVTEWPTTSVYGFTEGDEFVVKVFHHNGEKYLPLYTGIITPNDLPQLQRKAELFTKLGRLYEFRYDLKDCTRVSDDIVSCIRGKETEINGIRFRPFAMYTKRINTEYDLGSYEQIEVAFLLDFNGESQFFSMQYMKNECLQEKKAEKIFEVL
jgi:hypothetical protein